MRRKIETKHLILRSFESQDLNALVKYAGDIDVARATGQLPHQTQAPYLSETHGNSAIGSGKHVARGHNVEAHKLTHSLEAHHA